MRKTKKEKTKVTYHKTKRGARDNREKEKKKKMKKMEAVFLTNCSLHHAAGSKCWARACGYSTGAQLLGTSTALLQ